MTMNANAFDVCSGEELMKNPLAKFMKISATDCGNNGSTKDIIVI